MSEQDGLPAGWARATLGDLGKYVNGRGYSKAEWAARGRPIIRIQDLTGTGTERHYFSGDVEAWNLVQPGDLLVSWAATLGAFIWRGSEGCLNQHIFRVDSYINKLFHYYLVQSALDSLNGQTHGSGIVHITRDKFNALLVALPPLAEQERIVAAIEQQFSRLDAGVAALRRVQAALKRYRAAVLKAAVEGKFTEVWRAEHPDTEPASALLARILTERRARWEADLRARGKDSAKAHYEQPATPDAASLTPLPAGWTWALIDQMSIVVRGASPRPAGDPRYFGGSVPWITVGSLTADDKTYLTAAREFVTEAGCAASRFIVPDTLLLTNSGATLGVPKITLIGGCINDGSVALLHLDYPTKLYLYYFLASITARLRAINQGAAQPNLNTSIVKAIAVPLPPRDEQAEIVVEVERRLSVVSELDAAVAANLKRAERLRQSILERAFSGRLVPQDPNDEPSSVLLEHIRREQGEGVTDGSARRNGRRRGVVAAEVAEPVGARRSGLWDEARDGGE